jgi:putative ABC transport system permease protein
VTRLIRLAGARHFRRHPLLRALAVIGIALGVAVVVSIDLANESALTAFALSRRAVMGQATHQVVGGPAGVPEALFVRLRRELGLRAAAPIVEDYVSTPRAAGRALLLLGVDPLSEGPFRPYVGFRGGVALGPFLTVPGAAVLSTRLAAAVGVRVGDALPITVSGRAKSLRVVAVIEPPDDAASRALDDVLLCDISTAQEVLEKIGRLSRIDLVFDESSEGARSRDRVAEACGDRCDVVPAASQTLAATQMTRAFRLNTTALGFLALLVGMFLTYNTMTFIVVERRGLLGILRAVGVTRRELFSAIVAEAARLAAVATVLGLAAGIVLAKALVHLVSRTINDLYFVVNVRSLSIEPAILAKAAALGLGATVLSALVPAWEATRVAPGVSLRRSPRERSLARTAPAFALLGAVVVGGAVLLVNLADRSLLAAFGALFAVVFGAALATPLALRALAAVLGPIAGAALGMTGRMAARSITASLTRSSVAVSALTIAVATTVGVSVMVQSFRGAVAEWLDYSLKSDLFVQSPSEGSRVREATIAPDVARRIGACPGVVAVNTVRHRRVRTTLGDVDLHVPSYGDLRARGYRFRSGVPADIYRALDGDDALAITEPYAFRHGLAVGSTFDVSTDHGARGFHVAGIYVDFASDGGGILMSRATYDRHFDDRAISAMGIMAAPGANLSQLSDGVRACAGGDQVLLVRPARELRAMSLAIFDRTFAITSVLRLLCMLGAVVGILSALSALALERARELAVLRAIGMTPRQVRRMVTAQTTLLGLSAGLLSVPLGFALASFLVHVINRRSFGWSLDLVASPMVVVEAIALSVIAALVAGLYPAWTMSRSHPAAALREE